GHNKIWIFRTGVQGEPRGQLTRFMALSLAGRGLTRRQESPERLYTGQGLDIQVLHSQRIRFDKLPARVHLVTHQGSEELVGTDRILDGYLQHASALRIHGRFPQLLRIHFAQSLVALQVVPFHGITGQPLERLCEALHFLLTFAALHKRALLDQSFQRAAQLRNRLVLTRLEELRGEWIVTAQAMEGLTDMGQIEIALLVLLHRDRVALRPLGINAAQRSGDTLHPCFDSLRRGQLLHLQYRCEDHRLEHLRGVASIQTFHDGIGAVILLHDGIQRVTRDGWRLWIDIETRAFQRNVVLIGSQLFVVLQVLLVLTLANLVQGRLGNVDVPTLDELAHLPEKEGQQQGANVGAVNVRIGHDDDAVVAQVLGAEFLVPDTTAQCLDQRADLGRAQHLVETGLLHVEDLAFKGQDRLVLAVTTLFGRASRRVTLHN